MVEIPYKHLGHKNLGHKHLKSFFNVRHQHRRSLSHYNRLTPRIAHLWDDRPLCYTMDPIKTWDYCDCDPPPKLYFGDDSVNHNIINGQTTPVLYQYQTDTTPIPTSTSIATSSVPFSPLPTAEQSFDSLLVKSFQFPNSMPVYSFKGKCLRHCSTSDSDNLFDHYPFQVSVIIRNRMFRNVFSSKTCRKRSRSRKH